MDKTNNYCVIMAGGVGSRFWPLSTDKTPKQFLDILGTGKSFIRATYERFSSLIPIENFLVVTSADYKDQVMEHIPEIAPHQILLEPLRRNTAPCIAYASVRIKAICADNANVIVTPSDHLVTNNIEFERVIKLGLEYVSRNSSILTIGIEPSRTEVGYGYIQCDSSTPCEHIHKVRSFKEKPDLATATKYMESGDYLWNSGIFLWNNNTILAEYQRQLPQMYDLFASGVYNSDQEQQFINDIYPKCQKISIDYGIMEGANNRYVIPADFGWSDIGTWGSLYTHSIKDANNNALINNSKIIFEESKNCIVRGDSTMNIIIEGLDGYLIAQKDNNLIVCRIENEQHISDLSQRFTPSLY